MGDTRIESVETELGRIVTVLWRLHQSGDPGLALQAQGNLAIQLERARRKVEDIIVHPHGENRCRRCGVELVYAGRGRRRVYCETCPPIRKSALKSRPGDQAGRLNP